jgi:hypothetical protein
LRCPLERARNRRRAHSDSSCPPEDYKIDLIKSSSKSVTQPPTPPRRVLCPLERARNRRRLNSDFS